LRGNIGKSN